MIKKVFQFIAFFSLGAVVLYVVYRNQNIAFQEECAVKGIAKSNCSLLDKIFTDFGNTNGWFLILAVILFMLSNIARAARWNMMLQPLGTNARLVNTTGAIMMAYMANLVFPRVGEVVRSGILTKYEHLPIEKSFGTVMMDRLLDVICLLIVTGITFALAYHDIYDYFDKNFALGHKLSTFTNNTSLILGILVGIILLGTLMYLFRNKFAQSTIVQKIIKFIKGMIEGSASVLKVKNIPLFLLYTVIIWSMYFLMPYAVFKGFEPTKNLGPVPALVVFFMSSLGIVFPSPGGMGSYHFLVIAALAIYGVSGTDGFSYANIAFFSIQIAGTILFGLAAALFLPLYNRRYGNQA